jgi:integrase
MAEFMTELGDGRGIAAQALRFGVLTVARTSEILGAAWAEFDFASRIWRVPGVRMKMGEDHKRAPVRACDRGPRGNENGAAERAGLFPVAADRKPLSKMAMLAVLKRMNYAHVTVHGMRACFATWAEECTDYPDGVREAALAHKYKHETMAAYQRGDKLEKRRALMADWAAFCIAPESD